MSIFQYLTPDYQEKVLERWRPILDVGKKITNEQTALATALCLENTQREFDQPAVVAESYAGSMSQAGAFGAQTYGAPGGGAFDSYPAGNQYGGTASSWNTCNPNAAGDARMPTIVIPTARRIFPELLAHQTVGVQPMNGPVGFAFALRARYGVNGKGATDVENVEIGYNSIDSAFTGASGLTADIGTSSASATLVSYWQAFAGTGTATGLGVNTYGQDGQAATLGNSEWWNIGEDMPMAKFTMEKAVIEAKTRKLGSQWSLELAEDMMNMHGVDVDSEMVNIMSYEVQAEIDRQLLSEMVKAALDVSCDGANARVSTWSPVSADGRNQLERVSTLYTHILDKSNQIAITSRRGPATFGIASPKVCAIIERLQDFTLDTAPVAVDTGVVGIAKVGTLRNGSISLFRDTFAMGNYILLGYKGPTPYDSGIIYCPYIPIQLMRAVGQENFSPRVGVRTRYGMLNHLFGANNYYHFVKVEGLTSAALAADGGRIFTY